MRRSASWLVCLIFTHLVCFWFAAVEAADVDAIIGQPFGVAEVTVPFTGDAPVHPLGQMTVRVESPSGRVLYPTVTDGLIRRLFGGRLRGGQTITVMFLFQGDAPFDVTIGTATRQPVSVTPRTAANASFERMVRRWWRGYSRLFREMSEDQDEAHPPLLETYLTSMLARRLGLEQPLEERLRADMRGSGGGQMLDLLAGGPSIRERMARASSLGVPQDTAAANLPLPTGIAWSPAPLPDVEQGVDIEAMAMRVPQECFYVRFGEFSNLMWLTAILEDYGGEIGSMITARGYRTPARQRLEQQLVVKQGVLSELLGPQAIADVAAIGLDTFTRDGAAVGLLFQARSGLLGTYLQRQRQEALRREADHGATLVTEQIAGRDVAFLSTPDNRLRSFYVVDGDFHLVTNSRTLVQRFLAVAEVGGSLGQHREFRQARAAVPISRQDTIFVFVPSVFFHNLLSPQYQVELHRRLRAATDIELLELATLAARAEGLAEPSLDELVRAELLPPGFAVRPDGSVPERKGTYVLDSLRGARGFFTPVSDMAVVTVSETERDRYRQLAEHHAAHSQQFDPLVIALKRQTLDTPGVERVSVNAYITPLDDSNYQLLLSFLGEPSTQRLVPPADTILWIDAAVRGGTLFPSVPPHRLFVGLLDRPALARPHPEDAWRLLQILRAAPGFVGAWPAPGFLDILPVGWTRGSDDAGFVQLPFGVLRWQDRGFSVVARDQEILTQVSTRLGFEQEQQAAQLRVHVGDLSKARFRDWLNQLGYERARQVSVANVRLVSLLTQQLHVPPEEAWQVIERLLDAVLVCPLGGTYEIVEQAGVRQWRSTAWPTSRNYTVPDDFAAPVLGWLRGLECRVVKHPNRLVVTGQVDMQRKDRSSTMPFPLFNMWNGGGQGENEQRTPESSKLERSGSSPAIEY